VHVFCAEYAVTCVCLLGYHHLTAILTDEHGSDHDQTLYDHLRVLIYSRKIKLVVKDRYYQTPSNERCTPPTPPDNDVPPMTTCSQSIQEKICTKRRSGCSDPCYCQRARDPSQSARMSGVPRNCLTPADHVHVPPKSGLETNSHHYRP